MTLTESLAILAGCFVGAAAVLIAYNADWPTQWFSPDFEAQSQRLAVIELQRRKDQRLADLEAEAVRIKVEAAEQQRRRELDASVAMHLQPLQHRAPHVVPFSRRVH